MNFLHTKIINPQKKILSLLILEPISARLRNKKLVNWRQFYRNKNDRKNKAEISGSVAGTERKTTIVST